MGRFGWSSVRAKLVLMLAASALSIGLVAALGLYGMKSGQGAAEGLVRDGVETVARMGDLRTAFNGMARYEMDMLVNFESPPLTDAAKKQWTASHEASVAQLKALTASLPQAQAQEALRTIEGGIASYKKGLDELIPKLERGEVLSAGVGNQLMLEHRKGYASAATAVDALQSQVRQSVADSVQAQATKASGLTAGLAVVGLGGLVAMLVMGWLIARSIQLQLGAALALTEQIAGGDLRDNPLPAEAGRGEIGGMVESLGRMRTSLRELAAGVQSSAGEVATSSSEIAMGSRDLSDRTEQGASLLQELASSLDQVNELALTSVNAASEAADLARRVATGASASLAASNDAVLSMAAVTQDAGRIAEMTGVINGIAFQTNLLALNAAVEAARAGEQGKGFAVVAGEVRGLAQRAAEAARDIKSLLDSSSASVVKGNDAVRSAAAAAQGIGQVASSLSSLTDDLVGQSQTQTQCIAVVSGSAKSLDANSQLNSALAEQTHAASEALQAQAAHMRGLVQEFRV